MARFYNNFEWEIEVLTPLVIGSGDAPLSPYSDYFIQNGQCHYIDEKRLTELLAKDPALMDTFIERVKTTNEDNLPVLDLKDFIRHQMQIDPSTLVYKSVPAKGLDEHDRLPVRQIEKTAGRLYIPGSSMKGAVKTAILYDWMANQPATIVGNWADQIGTCFSTISDLLAAWCKEKELESPDRDVLKKLEERMKPEIDKLKDWFRENIEYQTFREKDKNKKSDKSHSGVFNMLRFADSPATMQDEDTQVIKTSRFNLFRESAAIPIATEAIRPGYTTTMQVSLDKQFAHTNMPELRKGMHAIWGMLLQFTNDTLIVENALINDTKLPDLNPGLYDRLLDIYDNNFLEKTNDYQILIRLGSGKNVIWNTVFAVLQEKHPEQFHQFRSLFRIGHRFNNEFPASMVVTDPGLEQLGWIKLKSKEV